MPIPENQLETWSHQGSIAQSAATYATIRGVLEDKRAPYAGYSPVPFLQGSYGNDTNIIGAESDVDVVLRLDARFNYDLSALDQSAQASFHAAYPNVAYGYAEFKSDVIGWLQSQFAGSVFPGEKAICVKGNGNRRDADVLPCLAFRRYSRFGSQADQTFAEGICFYMPDGTRIVNYPKQHSVNLTAKHQEVSQRLKPVVRMFKNARNRMIDKGMIGDGLAPSYFLEGMLHNVPSEKFAASYAETYISCVAWLLNCDRDSLLCANRQYYLLRGDPNVTWRPEKFNAFLTAAFKLWNDW